MEIHGVFFIDYELSKDALVSYPICLLDAGGRILLLNPFLKKKMVYTFPGVFLKSIGCNFFQNKVASIGTSLEKNQEELYILSYKKEVWEKKEKISLPISSLYSPPLFFLGESLFLFLPLESPPGVGIYLF